MESYSEEAPKMRTKRTETVAVPCSFEYGFGPSSTLGSNPSYVENSDDISDYVCRVHDSERPQRRPSLVEVESDDEPDDVPEEGLNPVQEGKRVICSVGGLLVDARFLKRLFKAPFRPYKGSLKDVSRGSLRIKGERELTLRLGARYELRTFVVVDRLHVNAILGTDTLKAFRAVIDLDENIMTLKDSGEVICPRVPASRGNVCDQNCVGGALTPGWTSPCGN
ncbi:hypothetical protein PR003_g18330 [Phytophthora rubi]|uniref:Aspartic peptidase DDI1-type domain-containing protein n=1 Tax=Phytophthora rubi TaxID=129364 RepID=A0A6A4E8Q3_9STRA|nr:hypothetical protein PR003_g18330 [Phytophthora rubi]